MRSRSVGSMPSLLGEFRQRVYEIVRMIPYGQVASYGFVARLVGMPRDARQVGWVLHALPDDLVWGRDSDVRHAAGSGPRTSAPVDATREARLGRVPWHRVINAQGRVSTHPDEYGTRRQIELLREEGIDVTDDGTLVHGLEAHRWHPDSDVIDSLEPPTEVRTPSTTS